MLLIAILSSFWYLPDLYHDVVDGSLLPWSEHRTITYAAEIEGSVDSYAAKRSLEQAVYMWDRINRSLEFKEVKDRPMIKVVFSDRHVIGSQSYYHGLATCESTWLSIFEGGRCRIDVYVPGAAGDAGVLTTVVMHEFGHVLGIGHTLEKDHLMYTYVGRDDEFLQEPFNPLNYNIPEIIR